MLGIIGALLFGTVVVGAWANDDNAEKARRNQSKKIGSDTYVDKKGKLRYTSNKQIYDWDTWRLREARNYNMRLYNGYCRVYKKHGVEPKSFREWLIDKYGTIKDPGFGYIYSDIELNSKDEFNI